MYIPEKCDVFLSKDYYLGLVLFSRSCSMVITNLFSRCSAKVQELQWKYMIWNALYMILQRIPFPAEMLLDFNQWLQIANLYPPPPPV